MKVFNYNLIAIAMMEVPPIIEEFRKEKNNKYKCNFNHAVGVFLTIYRLYLKKILSGGV
jgi:hypothetical protein